MNILIVDDNADAVQILAEMAKASGCEDIETVSSGEDAIGRAILQSYDLITLDIRMEGVSGLDALSVIRGLRPHTILAIISAYAHDIGPDDLAAADVVISKPVPLEKFSTLLQLIREIVDRRDAIRALGA